jgi:mRNA-degrading endonuclease RelE of RelBE toxin-antitoxin system
MKFYTTSTFRQTLASLTKKPKEGYKSVVKDICKALLSMEPNIIRDTNDRIKQFEDFRVIKLRLPNSGQRLSRPDGFRLIYYVSLISDDVALLRIYPKRGPQGIVDLVDEEYDRLLVEMVVENNNKTLHQVDINNSLAELDTNTSMF